MLIMREFASLVESQEEEEEGEGEVLLNADLGGI